MLVTDKKYYMEELLKEKLDLMIHRCTKGHMDNLIIIDGDEGFGKSSMGINIGYYVHHVTKRPFSVDNVFFDIGKLLDFAKNNKEQIIIWDEAALGGLSTDWRNKYQIELTKLLMVARKKRHFYIFNIPKFFKLNEYMLIDRSIALIHVYARNETELGRFIYFKKKNKEKLWYDRIKTRQRLYKKYYNFHGTFPYALPKLIDEKKYDKKKDEAILSIGVQAEKVSLERIKLFQQQHKLANSKIPHDMLADALDINQRTVRTWRNWDKKYPKYFPDM